MTPKPSGIKQMIIIFCKIQSESDDVIRRQSAVESDIAEYHKIIFESDNGNCRQNESDVVSECDNGNCRQSDVSQRRLQQRDQHDEFSQRRIREFDKITYQHRQKYIAKFGNEHHHPKFKWQKSFHDHIIRVENDFNNHWNYTMYNYSKHNLPENWKYTGLNYPDLIDDINDVKIV